MTLQQLRYAIEIEKCGSLSKAAKKLFVSQPNLSNSMKDLETEFGITIFKRNNRGVQITEKGATFLIYARSVLNQCEKMKTISEDNSSSSFRLIAQNYSPIMESFIKFVKLNSDNEKIKFELTNERGIEVIDKVYKQEADLGVLLIMQSSRDEFITHLNDRNLSYTSLGKLGFYVKVRSGHPALEHKETIFHELYKYPYVHYKESMYIHQTDVYNSDYIQFINFDKEIHVFDRSVKCKIVSETNAYSIGCKMHSHLSEIFNWVLIPIPDVYTEIGYFHKKSIPMGVESLKYIELLKEELRGLVL